MHGVPERRALGVHPVSPALRAAAVPFLGLALWLAAAGCAGTVTPPARDASQAVIHEGDIIRLSDGARIDRAELLKELSTARVVLLGEKHDNPAHHREQADLIQALSDAARGGGRVGASIEMIDADQQDALDGGRPPTTAAELAARVGWEDSGWPAFEMYAPVFEALLAQDARIVAAGVPRAHLMALAGGAEPPAVGVFEDGWERPFGLEAPLPAAAQAAMEQLMQEAHCGLLPPKMVEPMVRVQRLRDALLAAGLTVALAGKDRAFLIAGAGHVRKDLGVPVYLRYAGVSGVRAVAMVESTGEDASLESYRQEYGARFDYLVVTEALPAEDHCAELRSHFKTAQAGTGAE